MDDLDAAMPNCPACLLPLEPEGEPERPWWRCPDCGRVSLSV